MEIKNCRSCGSSSLISILDLGDQPWCNDLLDEDTEDDVVYPLHLVYCTYCFLHQLNYTVPKEVMFTEHGYRSGMTKTLENHFYSIAKELKDSYLEKEDLVIDIGGNDGTQLKQFQKLGILNVTNIESAWNISTISKDSGVPTINAFFNESTARDNFKEGSVKLINAAGVFFHLEELHSVIDGVTYLLKDDGVFNIQCMYAAEMVKQNTYDMIYHEHLCFYTLKSLSNLLNPHGLYIFDAYYSPIHSGSLIVRAGKGVGEETDRLKELQKEEEQYSIDKFHSFAEYIRTSKGKVREYLESLKREGKKVYAYGSPAKGNTLLNYEEIDKHLIDKAVEINDLKCGKILPVSKIPIEKESKEDYPDYYLLLSHNFKEEIIRNNEDLINRGVKFIVPFPTLEVIGD